MRQRSTSIAWMVTAWLFVVETGAAMAQDEEPPASGVPSETETPPLATPFASEPAHADARAILLTVDDFVSIRDPETRAKVADISVTPGETVVFRVDNIGSISHNFYIGTEEELKPQFAVTEVGLDEWSGGVEELAWTVPEDISGLKFGCTVHDHYFLMQGTFSISP